MFGPAAAVPAVLGTAPPKTNSASLQTTGWGVSIRWQDQIKKEFSYHIKLMASSNQSTITKYYNPNKLLSNYYVGQKLGEIWGFKVDGLFQSKKEINDYLTKIDISQVGKNWQPGDVKYRDLNGDGVVDYGDNTLDNHGDRVIIGNSHPRNHFSIFAGVSWKGFSLNMLWQGVGKRDIMPTTRSSLFWGWSNQAFTHVTPEVVNNHWSKDNPDGYLPIPINGANVSGFAKDRHPSDRYIQSAAYVRLKSLRLGYSLPSSFTDKIDIKNITVYVNGENLLTFTKMWPNIDPELSHPSGRFQQDAGMAYPLAQTFGFGINVTF